MCKSHSFIHMFVCIYRPSFVLDRYFPKQIRKIRGQSLSCRPEKNGHRQSQKMMKTTQGLQMRLAMLIRLLQMDSCTHREKKREKKASQKEIDLLHPPLNGEITTMNTHTKTDENTPNHKETYILLLKQKKHGYKKEKRNNTFFRVYAHDWGPMAAV